MTGLRLVFSPRGLIAATGMCALGLVAGGVVLAQTMNLAACPLCVLQRMLYLLLALEAALALSMARASAVRRLMALVMAATAFTGAWIAAYQTWLQRFAKGVSCTADQPWWEHFVNWRSRRWRTCCCSRSTSCPACRWTDPRDSGHRIQFHGPDH